MGFERLNISFDDAYSAISREPFVIKPEVAAKEFVPDAYTYEWKAYDQAGSRNRLCWVRL